MLTEWFVSQVEEATPKLITFELLPLPMGEVSDSKKRLKQKVEDELDTHEELVDYEFQEDEASGILGKVNEADEVKLYHVTLERLPDGTEETHWTYLGPVTDND